MDGDDDGIFGQRFDNGGNPLGEEFQVNTYTTGRQHHGSVASDANGNFIVVWQSEHVPGWGIFGQRYDSDGNSLDGEFQVNARVTGLSSGPSVASDANGNFIVVWNRLSGEASIIPGQRYDGDGKPLGGEFQVNTYTSGLGGDAAVASDVNGNFVVVWSYNQDGDGYGVFGQRFSGGCNASLQVQGDVHTPGSNVAIKVHIAHRRPKTVTVPWELRLLDPSGQEIVKRTPEPHTFEPGDVVDRNVEFRLPDDLAAGTYTLELGISGMAGTKGATTTLRVVRAE